MARSVRHSTVADLDEICAIYAYARQFMRETGNPNQWKTTNPPRSVIEQDIQNGVHYVIEEDGIICGAFFFRVAPDPTYRVIEDGAWPDEEPYGVIHRIAGNGKAHGILQTAVAFTEPFCSHLRIDTHRDNQVMQAALKKAGFVRRGIIYLANGEERIAFSRE